MTYNQSRPFIKNLIIIGAGGYGREIYDLAKTSIGYNTSFIIKGFLDSNLQAIDNKKNYLPVLSTVEDYNIVADDVFVIAIANIESKKKCVSIIDEKKGHFFSLVHTSAVIAQNTSIGNGCVIGRNVILSNDCTIGDHCTFNSKAMVGHDCTLGNFGNFNAGSFIGGECKVGIGVTIHTYGIVTPRLKIGNDAVIGAGSVVIKDVPEKTTVFGNPAKVIW